MQSAPGPTICFPSDPPLLGAEPSPVQREAQSEVMIVTTRAEASRRKEEEILQNEKEARSGVKSNPILKEGASESSRPVQITQQQRQSGQDVSKSTTQTDSFFCCLDLTSEEVSKLQEEDITLSEI